MALSTGCRGRDVVGRLGAGGDVTCEGRRRGMAAVAVATGRVVLVERCRGPRVTRRGVRAGGHTEVLRALVTGLAAVDAARPSDRGVSGRRERRSIDARGAELEAPRVDVGGRVAARAAAIEGPDRDVIPRA